MIAETITSMKPGKSLIYYRTCENDDMSLAARVCSLDIEASTLQSTVYDLYLEGVCDIVQRKTEVGFDYIAIRRKRK